MNKLRHPLVTAFGIATVILMGFVDLLTSSLRAGLFYHWDGPATVIIGSVFLTILIVWTAFSLLLLAVRNHPTASRFAWIFIGIIVLRELLEGIYIISSHPAPITSYIHYPSNTANAIYGLSVLLVCLSLTVRSIRQRPIWGQIKNLLTVVLGFIAISGAMTVGQLLIIGWTARNLNTPKPLHVSSPSIAANHKRIIWLVLDELSYDQVYEHRFPGLQLPEFDRLASQSTVFTHAVPAGMWTEEVLPSLLIGRDFELINYHTAGPLDLQLADTHKWERFDPKDSIFQDAIDHGYRTAVSGWYNPYCRLFHDQLDACHWNNIAPLSISGLFHGGSGILANTKYIFLNMAEWRFHQLRLHILPSQGEWGAANNLLHLEAYQDLVPQGDKILLDPSLNFLFLHIDVPHPPGIYNRHTQQFSIDGTSYIDNLALADKYLGHLHDELVANGTWNDTTIVIMGDHSWRTKVEWADTPLWHPEDQLASNGGQFDPRPGYIVKLAGQTTPAHIDAPFNAVRSRELVNALMASQITTPEQLAAWAK